MRYQGLIEYRREIKGSGDGGDDSDDDDDGDGDGGGDGDSDSDGVNDSAFHDPSECQVHLLVIMINDNKTNGDTRDVILSIGSVISGV